MAKLPTVKGPTAAKTKKNVTFVDTAEATPEVSPKEMTPNDLAKQQISDALDKILPDLVREERKGYSKQEIMAIVNSILK